MATMATQTTGGGIPTLNNTNATPTPPSTAAPSQHTSRQVSREPSATMNNNPYDGRGGVGGANDNDAAGGATATVGGAGDGRGIRANSLVEHPLPTAGGRAAAISTASAGAGGTNSLKENPPAPRGQVLTNEPTATTTTTTNKLPSATTTTSTTEANNNSSSSSPTTAETISYSAERIIGNGSFGVVFQASVVETGEIVAIKKVLQDKRFKNRELQIMRLLVKDGHSNIVALKHCFYSQVRERLFVCFVYCFVYAGDLDVRYGFCAGGCMGSFVWTQENVS